MSNPKIELADRPDTQEDERDALLSVFRKALTEISETLKMPGSPDLTIDVPNAVKALVSKLDGITVAYSQTPDSAMITDKSVSRLEAMNNHIDSIFKATNETLARTLEVMSLSKRVTMPDYLTCPKCGLTTDSRNIEPDAHGCPGSENERIEILETNVELLKDRSIKQPIILYASGMLLFRQPNGTVKAGLCSECKFFVPPPPPPPNMMSVNQNGNCSNLKMPIHPQLCCSEFEQK